MSKKPCANLAEILLPVDSEYLLSYSISNDDAPNDKLPRLDINYKEFI